MSSFEMGWGWMRVSGMPVAVGVCAPLEEAERKGITTGWASGVGVISSHRCDSGSWLVRESENI